MTNLLRTYSKRKSGWRVKFLMEKGTTNVLQDRVMIINGMGAEYLIEAGTDNPDKIGHYLEDRATKAIKQLEEKDLIFTSQEALLFAVFARAIRSQSQCFVNMLVREKKHDLQMFNNHVDKMVRSLEINYEKLLGKEQAQLFLDEQEDVVYDMFSGYKTAILNGELRQFVDYIKAFNNPAAMGKEIKMKVVDDTSKD